MRYGGRTFQHYGRQRVFRPGVYRQALLALGSCFLIAQAPAHAQSGVIAQTDAEVAKAMADPDVKMVRNVSHQELREGVAIVEGSGQTIGTVTKVAGNTIVISDGTETWRVPIEQIYAYSDGEADHFASRLSREQLSAERKGG